MAMWAPNLEQKGSKPLYEAIVDALEKDIQSGVLRAGDYLPSYRLLAGELGISPGTAERAYSAAVSRGLVVRHVGRGTTVLPVRTSEIYGRSARINLSVNLPLQHLGPDLAKGLLKAARRPALADLLHYCEAAGLPEHREAGARFLAGVGLEVDAGRVVICSGGQHAIDVALATVAEPGDSVLVEDTTYPGMLVAARARGIQITAVKTDGKGIVPEALGAACKADRVRALFFMPTVHNPTGITMPPERRAQIAKIVDQNGLLLIEDDAYRFMNPKAPTPLAAVLADRTFYIHPLSKSLAPGLRVAFMVVPERMLNATLSVLIASMTMTTALAVELCCRWLVDGTHEDIIAQKQSEAGRRMALARDILEPFEFMASDPGLYLWLRLPRGQTSSQFAAQTFEQGVSVTPSEAFVSMPTKTVPPYIRVCLGGPRDTTELEQGLRVVHQTLGAAGQAAKATM